MISKDVFIKEIGKLVIEYGDKGFTMSKEKAEQWYGYMKIEFTDEVFRKGIDSLLVYSNKTPTMADVMEYCKVEKTQCTTHLNIIKAPEDWKSE